MLNARVKPDQGLWHVMRSSDEAKAYMTKLRSIVRYLGTCDGNMGLFDDDEGLAVFDGASVLDEDFGDLAGFRRRNLVHAMIFPRLVVALNLGHPFLKASDILKPPKGFSGRCRE